MREARQTKAVLFDFGQTLVDSAGAFRAAEKYAKDALFNALTARPGGPDWDTFVSFYRGARREFHQKSEFSRAAIWQHVADFFGRRMDPNLLQKWERTYWDRVGSHTEPFPETIQVLDQLSSHYDLALVSNTQGQLRSGGHRLALFPRIAAYFKVVIIAGESGIPAKPHSKPFHLCLQRMGRSPQEAVYVGDDWRIDVEGAQNAGIQPVWLKHRLVARSWPRFETDAPTITDLRELPGLSVLR